jgi:hypothetical protein
MTEFRDKSAPNMQGDCRVCGNSLKPQKTGRPPKFCSDACRKAGQRRRENTEFNRYVSHPRYGVGFLICNIRDRAYVQFAGRDGYILRDLLAESIATHKGPRAPKKRSVQFDSKWDVTKDPTFADMPHVPWFRQGRTLRKNFYPASVNRLVKLMEGAYGKDEEK